MKIHQLRTLILVFTLGWAADASAMLVGKTPMVYDETERRLDQSPPTVPTLELADIGRGTGPVQFNGVSMRDAEGDIGSIVFRVSGAADDRTSQGEIGYRLHFVDGELPRRLEISDDAFLGGPILYWNDGGTWEQEPFMFRVRVTAVDRGGNESLPSNVVIVGHDGDTRWYETQYKAQAQRNYMRWQDPYSVPPDSVLAPTDPWRYRATRIEDVYRPSTLELLKQVRSARIDRVSNMVIPDANGAANTHELTEDEVTQLISILLDPRNFSRTSAMCEFMPEFSFTVHPPNGTTEVMFSHNCNMIRMRIDGVDRFGYVFPLVGPFIHAFCEGLLTLPTLADME